MSQQENIAIGQRSRSRRGRVGLQHDLHWSFPGVVQLELSTGVGCAHGVCAISTGACRLHQEILFLQDAEAATGTGGHGEEAVVSLEGSAEIGEDVLALGLCTVRLRVLDQEDTYGGGRDHIGLVRAYGRDDLALDTYLLKEVLTAVNLAIASANGGGDESRGGVGTCGGTVGSEIELIGNLSTGPVRAGGDGSREGSIEILGFRGRTLRTRVRHASGGPGVGLISARRGTSHNTFGGRAAIPC